VLWAGLCQPAAPFGDVPVRGSREKEETKMQLFTDLEQAKVFLQAMSVLVSVGGVILLVCQIRATGKHVADASIRFLWAQLRSERLQMEADVTKIDIKQNDSGRRRQQLENGIKRVSRLSQILETEYPDAFIEPLRREAAAQRDSPLDV
jgi:hypothetical protein